MRTVLTLLLVMISLQALAEDSIASGVPVVSTPEESKYSATTSINGWFNGSLASEFKDRSVFVIKVGDDKLDAFVDSVFVAHGIKLASRDDADVLVSFDDTGIAYARADDDPTYAKYIPVVIALDQDAAYQKLVVDASTAKGAGGQTWSGGGAAEIIIKQIIFRIASSDAVARAIHSNAKTGPFDQTLWVNVSLKIKGADGKYNSKKSSFVAKTKDEILRIKKEELFASALDCMIICSK